MRYLLLAFVVVPLVELYLLIWLSQRVGFAFTLTLTIVTGVVGSSLAKREGFRAMRQWQRSLDTLTVPETGLIEAALILAGGLLLLTPGVLTDAVGFLLLLPVSRKPVARLIRARAVSYIDGRQGPTRVPGGAAPRNSPDNRVIETTGEDPERP